MATTTSGTTSLPGKPDPMKRKEIYRYTAPWVVYGMNWSFKPDKRFRLAIGSFIEDYCNKVQIVQLNEETGNFSHTATFDHPYPTTKIMWIPDMVGQLPDLVATSGDYLRLWRINGSDVRQECMLNNSKNSEFCAPLTSFDWNETDPNILGASSIDTTCTIWGLEVHDIAFTRAGSGRDLFASVGSDGSVRLFDLRNLEHSTILYEEPKQQPLLRLSWNRQDPNYLSTFALDSHEVIIMDIRAPSTPVARLCNHRAPVNGITWAPHSSCHICTAGDDHQALIWDIQQMPQSIDVPILAYNAQSEINQVQWSVNQSDWIAICFKDNVEILRV
ncbi:PREDICTED: DDB1- and CUL4-associated factor 7-like isoform X2 [Amphimedon queenslandica]|uniref:Histone-binding protein RBBP4 N-terminal domain-containing protein n=1 Tax=Amphimedon queenslandica TaxID=400682 RepID=A0AAN0J0B0_AMPQE|nr:PREDICTED: DDB1- and CUL4-associated factor 7-like isoform X2 [Amphimedon queenslandica]|eukprot:XP_019850450.1 PREDICTED: DDB1- and CUL4-associated factor 7-like isoform X2 [Amphimedon queenslandica]